MDFVGNDARLEEGGFAAACLEQSPLAHFSADRSGRILYANRKYRERFSEANWVQFVNDADRSRAQIEWDACLAGSGQYEGQFKCGPTASSVIWIQCISQGAASPIHGTIQDVSSSSQLRALLKSERIFRTIVQSSINAVITVDSESRVTSWEGGAERIFGRSAEECLGKSLFDICFDPSQEKLLTSQYPVTCGERSHRFEMDGLNRDGSPVPVEVGLARHESDEPMFSVFVRDLRAQKEEEQERQKLVSVIENSTDIIILADLEGNLIYANPEGCGLLGLGDHEQLKQLKLASFYPEAREHKWREVWDRLQRTGRWEGEAVLQNASTGEPVEVFQTLFVVKDKISTKSLCLANVCRDISDRRQAERERDTSFSLLHAALESAADSILVVDRDHKILTYNQKFMDLWGVSEELLQTNDANALLELVSERVRDREAFTASILEMYEKPEESSFDMVEAKDGRVLERYSQPQMLGGKSVGRVWSYRDVTRQRESEEARTRERNLLRTLIDHLPEYVYVKDLQSKYLLNNITHAKLFGCRVEELVGKCDHDFYAKELADRYLADERDLMESGRALLNHAEISTDSDGQIVWNSTTKVPLCDSHGQVIGLIGLTRNITEQKRAQQALEEAAKKLEDSNKQLQAARDEAVESAKVKSQFLANMSHEIRTPMNGVIGMVNILLDSRLDQDQREAAETIRVSAEALLEIINEILDFSKIEAGKMVIEQIPFDLAEVLRTSAKLLEPKAKEKNVEMVVKIAPDLPNLVLGDPVRLRQIVLNLLGNAVKFTEDGTTTVKLESRGRDGNRFKFRLSVIDTGIGIPIERHNAIFESFTQADGSSTRRYGGSGLGLTISRQLVLMMGGHIGVNSEPGEGSEFWVDLSLPIAEGARLEAPEKPSLAGGDLHGFRLLIAEDNPINRKVALRQLEGLGCMVKAVTNGEEAVHEFATGEFDAILMDCQMPVMDGYEATEAIRDRERQTGGHVPVIAMTANALEGDRDRCIESGMDDYLSKPVRPQELFEMLQKWKPIEGLKRAA